MGQAQDFGCQDMVGPLRKVLVRRPGEAFANADPKKWHYTSPPDLAIAQQEHDGLVAILKKEGVDVVYHDDEHPGLADSIFVYDPALVARRGAIVLRMGKDLRRGEEEALEKRLGSEGIPTLLKLRGDATVEGGDTLWLDHQTLAVGQGYRSNEEGLRQLREGLAPFDIQVIGVELAHWDGEEACLHLMSLISPVADHTAVVYRRLLPVPFIKRLQAMGYTLIDVPDREFLTMGPNVLAIRPGVVLALDGNPITKSRMEAAGIHVYSYKGDELSLKAEGGPTCLTRPLLRASFSN